MPKDHLGRHFDKETSDYGPQTLRVMTIPHHDAAGHYSLRLYMPARVAAILKQEDYDKVEIAARADVERFYQRGVVALLRRWEIIAATQQHLEASVPDALYRRFSQRQIEIGNNDWVVPASLQPDALHEGAAKL